MMTFEQYSQTLARMNGTAATYKMYADYVFNYSMIRESEIDNLRRENVELTKQNNRLNYQCSYLADEYNDIKSLVRKLDKLIDSHLRTIPDSAVEDDEVWQTFVGLSKHISNLCVGWKAEFNARIIENHTCYRNCDYRDIPNDALGREFDWDDDGEMTCLQSNECKFCKSSYC